MAALTAPRPITQLGVDVLPPSRALGIATNVVVFHGALVAVNASGYVVPATATTSQRAIGVADLEMWNDQANTGQAMPATLQTPGYKIDTTGVSNGVRKCVVRHGTFKFNNKGGDLVTVAKQGIAVSIEDDNTVRATSTGSSQAGILQGFADDGLPLVLVTPTLA